MSSVKKDEDIELEEEVELRESNIKLLNENKKLKGLIGRIRKQKVILVGENKKLKKDLQTEKDAITKQKMNMVNVIKKVRSTIDIEKKKNTESTNKFKEEIRLQKIENSKLQKQIEDLSSENTSTKSNEQESEGEKKLEQIVEHLKMELVRSKRQIQALSKKFGSQKVQFDELEKKHKKVSHENRILKKIKDRQSEFLVKLRKEVGIQKMAHSSYKKLKQEEMKKFEEAHTKDVLKIREECERYVQRSLKVQEKEKENKFKNMKDQLSKDFKAVSTSMIDNMGNRASSKKQKKEKEYFKEENELTRFMISLMVYKEKMKYR